MRIWRMWQATVGRVAGLAAALLCIAGIPSPVAPATDDAKPALIVVVESAAILAGRSVGVHVWVDNLSDKPITDVRIALAAPSDLTLQWSRDGKAWYDAAGGAVELARSMAPHRALVSPYGLRVTASHSVQEEDVNVAFALGYGMQGPAGRQTGTAVVEKSLSVGLLGTQTVAGVSLRLTFLFIPGALMLMALNLFKIPVVSQLDATSNAIVTVMVSSGLSLLVSRLASQGWLFWLKPEVGVSLAMLVTVTALALLIAAGVIAWRLRQIAAEKAAAAAVTVGDNDKLDEMLAKALKSAQGDFDPVTVTRRDTTYVGAAAARTLGGGMVVMGWYNLQTKDPGLRASLEALLGAKNYVGALEAAKGGASLVQSDVLRERHGEEPLQPSSINGPLRIPSKDKPEATRTWTAGLDVTAPPLVLADP